MSRVIACSFSSGIDDMKRKDQGDTVAVLKVLQECGRFSVFEATDNPVIARTMTRIFKDELVIDDKPSAFPWRKVKLTDAGLALIAEDDDDHICPYCNGTGEGATDSARCGHCKGRG